MKLSIRLNKAISFGLIFIIISPFWIVYSLLQFEKQSTKREIKRFLMHNVSKDELVQLKFHVQDVDKILDWEHEKEFEYSGVMYDIVDQKIEGDSVSYWCWEDSEETALNKKIYRLTAKALESSSNSDRLSGYNIFLITLMIPSKSEFQFEPREITAKHFNSNTTDLLTTILEISTPPPQFRVSQLS